MMRFVFILVVYTKDFSDPCSAYQRKFNVPVTVTLLRHQLITPTDEDLQLAKWLYGAANTRPNLQDFAAGLIRECLFSEPPITTQQQFHYTLDALTQLMRANKATESYVHICPPVTRG